MMIVGAHGAMPNRTRGLFQTWGRPADESGKLRFSMRLTLELVLFVTDPVAFISPAALRFSEVRNVPRLQESTGQEADGPVCLSEGNH
jgi:hypothetical protein